MQAASPSRGWWSVTGSMAYYPAAQIQQSVSEPSNLSFISIHVSSFRILTGLCGSLFHSCLFCQSAAALGLPWKRWFLIWTVLIRSFYFRWWVLSLCLPMHAPLRTLTREKYWLWCNSLTLYQPLCKVLSGWKLRGGSDFWSLLWALCQLSGFASARWGALTFRVQKHLQLIASSMTWDQYIWMCRQS